MGNRRVEYVAKPSRQGFRTDFVSDSYLRTENRQYSAGERTVKASAGKHLFSDTILQL